ncbi:tetratricopeptide repeat-containing sulfotransferase family protein [uncultured Sphingomonas sp.]|uniref:tetratricopeptide repeat-containing sulfotransferase family protein n=1 Tax=uncultured Sphingomonas sp. TaxID=158754 RepID=UPI00262120AA|nr:tetratricopeptide repeat-containing sulfotransferase family protein [uncultured Sphingomonas sp.]
MRDATGTLDVALGHARGLLNRDPTLAVEQAREILNAVPGHVETLLLLAEALARTNREDEAIGIAAEACRRDPRSPHGSRLIGDLLYGRGRFVEADEAYRRHIAVAVNHPRLRKAALSLSGNDLPAAEALLRAHLGDHPTDVAAMRMLAELEGRLAHNREAEALLRRALARAPGFLMARYNLAIVLNRQHRPAEALIEIDRLLEIEPDNPSFRNLSGAARGAISAHGDALAEFEKALRGRPDNAAMWMSYGHTLKTLGRRDDGIAAYRRSIALRPAMGEAWWSLANLKATTFGADDIAAMRTALADDRTTLGFDDRFHLHFALGKALEDAGDYAASFRHYGQGNRLRRERVDYDADETHDQVVRSESLFTADFFAARAGQGCLAPNPIFVLGMPRSGSTLVEQILASHSQVEGTRELPDIQALAHRLSGRRMRSDLSHYPEAIADCDPAALRALGEEYIDRVRIHRKTDRPFFIDKMPNNWAHVGLIHLILPNATIIDTRRHPLGCGFSIFKQHFARGQNFSYSLAEIGRYYADYVRAMAHVDAVLPGRVHRVAHEDMVEDTDRAVRALLAACGLAFEPACLRFWETDRAIQTASSEQVRRPIFREGLDQWRHYDPWLGPLRTVLKSHLPPHFAAGL